MNRECHQSSFPRDWQCTDPSKLRLAISTHLSDWTPGIDFKREVQVDFTAMHSMQCDDALREVQIMEGCKSLLQTFAEQPIFFFK